MTRGVVAVIGVEVTNIEGDKQCLHGHDVGRSSCGIKHRKSYDLHEPWCSFQAKSGRCHRIQERNQSLLPPLILTMAIGSM